MSEYCKCRYPRSMIAIAGKSAGEAFCAKCLRGFKPQPPHASKLVSTHTKAEKDYPVYGSIISFERISRGIAPPDPEVTECDICKSTAYLVHKCPDGLYRCSTCFSKSVHIGSNYPHQEDVK